MIDTGEAENVIAKYLLDKGIKTVDYLIISHFDSDHCNSSKEVIEKLNVKQLVISKQAKESKEFEDIISMAKEKNINIQVVKAGDILKFDKYTSFKVLWPDTNLLQESPLNNNSIVARLEYKSFSMLFTGDIEALAEKQIVARYKSEELKSDILKVAHHGSKTSSTNEFINKIKPQISIIGEGENNKFVRPESLGLGCSFVGIGSGVFHNFSSGTRSVCAAPAGAEACGVSAAGLLSGRFHSMGCSLTTARCGIVLVMGADTRCSGIPDVLICDLDSDVCVAMGFRAGVSSVTSGISSFPDRASFTVRSTRS